MSKTDLPRPPDLPNNTLTFMPFQQALKEEHSRCFVVNLMAAEEPDGPANELAEDSEIPKPQCDQRLSLCFILLWSLTGMLSQSCHLVCHLTEVSAILSILVPHLLFLSPCIG